MFGCEPKEYNECYSDITSDEKTVEETFEKIGNEAIEKNRSKSAFLIRIKEVIEGPCYSSNEQSKIEQKVKSSRQYYNK